MTKTDRYVECSAAGMKYRLIPVTDEIIRCMIAKDEVKTEQESLIIEKKEYPQVPFEAAEADEVVTVKTSAGRTESQNRRDHLETCRWKCVAGAEQSGSHQD